MEDPDEGWNQEKAPRERLFARDIDDVVSRVEAMEARLREAERIGRENASALRSHGARIDRLRIDKQIAGLPRWILNRLRSAPDSGNPQSPPFTPNPKRLLLFAPKYPSATAPYGGQPMERRVSFYTDKGFDVAVFVHNGADLNRNRRNGVHVVRGPATAIPDIIRDWKPGQICWHHPLPDLWPWLRSYVDRVPLHVWIHGFEARSWHELEFNYTSEEIASKRSHWDALEVDRRKLLNELFANEQITKVFVSEFMRNVAESFAGVTAANGRVIHNVIDTERFKNERKEPSARNRIVSIRSFAARNYATDLLAATIEHLSRKGFFDQLSFEIYGDGRHFEEDIAVLHKFPNVSVFRKFVEVEEMVEVFSRSGVLLIPTRWDSQGMTIGEGMSAGLVPVTNGVAAIPEFLDESCGVMADPESVDGLAEGISMLHFQPDLFEDMSRHAAKRVRDQCGPAATVAEELVMFKGATSTRI